MATRRHRWAWTRRMRRRYPHAVVTRGAHDRVAPIPHPASLDRFAGLWVAVIDGEVVAAEETSHKLALKLNDMDHRKRRQVVTEYVRPTGDAFIVGAG